MGGRDYDDGDDDDDDDDGDDEDDDDNDGCRDNVWRPMKYLTNSSQQRNGGLSF